jgi:hypothetical protein
MFSIEVWTGKQWQQLKRRFAERCLAEKAASYMKHIRIRIIQEK